MQRRGYVVEIQNHDIVVRVTGTSYTATYHRLGDSLLARNLPLRDDHRAPIVGWSLSKAHGNSPKPSCRTSTRRASAPTEADTRNEHLILSPVAGL